MKISGSFLVKDQYGIISSGKNLIVNNGKKIITNWLTHQSFVNNDADYIYQGKSFFSQRFLTAEQFTVSNVSANIQQFWDTTTKTTISNGTTIYLQIVDGKINLSGLFFYLPYSQSTTNSNCRDYIFRYKIYTSEYVYSQANSNNNWTLQKVCINTTKSKDAISNQKMIRFENANSVDNYIPQVKSIKIVFNNIGGNNSMSLNGIGILSKELTSNVPCVIGLGTSIVQPTQSDTQLGTQICKLFVNNQKCYITYQQSSSSSDTVSLLRTFDVNSFEESDLNDVNCVNVVYRSRMNYSEYNGYNFKQIGLFYSNNRVDYLSTASQCKQMFSHGIFDNSWTKNSEQIIDIEYTLSITV